MKHDLVVVIAHDPLLKVEAMEATTVVMAAVTVEVFKGSKWRYHRSDIAVHLPQTESLWSWQQLQWRLSPEINGDILHPNHYCN